MIDDTLNTYNSQSSQLAEYFRLSGSRLWDINNALKIAGKTDGSADVLEIGCADGYDAIEIISKCRTYKGLDYSKGMVDMAKSHHPKVDISVADMRTYNYPPDAYDIIFAFASILNISNKDLKDLLSKLALSIRQGGVMYITAKYGDTYKEIMKEDSFGLRKFYLYNPQIISQLAGENFTLQHESHDRKKQAKWFQVALCKK